MNRFPLFFLCEQNDPTTFSNSVQKTAKNPTTRRPDPACWKRPPNDDDPTNPLFGNWRKYKVYRIEKTRVWSPPTMHFSHFLQRSKTPIMTVFMVRVTNLTLGSANQPYHRSVLCTPNQTIHFIDSHYYRAATIGWRYLPCCLALLRTTSPFSPSTSQTRTPRGAREGRCSSTLEKWMDNDTLFVDNTHKNVF